MATETYAYVPSAMLPIGAKINEFGNMWEVLKKEPIPNHSDGYFNMTYRDSNGVVGVYPESPVCFNMTVVVPGDPIPASSFWTVWTTLFMQFNAVLRNSGF